MKKFEQNTKYKCLLNNTIYKCCRTFALVYETEIKHFATFCDKNNNFFTVQVFYDSKNNCEKTYINNLKLNSLKNS